MPTILKRSLALIAAGALGLSTLPALADSTSSASSASSASVGSSSTSLEKSSNSSSTKEQVAQGNYTIVEMTALTDQPDRLRLRLQPVTQPSAQEFVLLLPRQQLNAAIWPRARPLRQSTARTGWRWPR